ncbi:hypothetical protein ACQ4PT_030381 [Festuca glaucescens]
MVGSGATLRFWEDPWLQGLSVAAIAPAVLRLVRPSCIKRRTVRDAVLLNAWALDITGELTVDAVVQYLKLWSAVASVQLGVGEDTFRWKWTADGVFSVRLAYRAFFHGTTALPGAAHVWHSFAPFKHSRRFCILAPLRGSAHSSSTSLSSIFPASPETAASALAPAPPPPSWPAHHPTNPASCATTTPEEVCALLLYGIPVPELRPAIRGALKAAGRYARWSVTRAQGPTPPPVSFPCRQSWMPPATSLMSGEVDLAAAVGRNTEGGPTTEEEGLKNSSEPLGSCGSRCFGR